MFRPSAPFCSFARQKVAVTGQPVAIIRRYIIVDIVRGLSAALILLWHYQHFYYISPNHNLIENDPSVQPFFNVLRPAYLHGSGAVQMFWVISGFVFCHVYGNRPRVQPFEFFTNRMARLYPLHFLTLLLVAALQLLSRSIVGHNEIYNNNDLYHFVLQLFFASNWGANDGFSFNGPIWSVSVEVLIYAVFLAVLMVYRANIASASLITLVAAALWTRPLIGWLSIDVPLCAMFFFAGVVVYRINMTLSSRSETANLGLSVAGILVTIVVRLIAHKGGTPIELLLFSTIVWLAAAAEHLKFDRFVSRVHWVGDITYSSYLLHIPLQISILIVLDSVIGTRDVASSRVFFLAFMASVLLLAMLSYKYIEQPAQKLLRLKAQHWLLLPPSVNALPKPWNEAAQTQAMVKPRGAEQANR